TLCTGDRVQVLPQRRAGQIRLLDAVSEALAQTAVARIARIAQAAARGAAAIAAGHAHAVVVELALVAFVSVLRIERAVAVILALGRSTVAIVLRARRKLLAGKRRIAGRSVVERVDRAAGRNLFASRRRESWGAAMCRRRAAVAGRTGAWRAVAGPLR